MSKPFVFSLVFSLSLLALFTNVAPAQTTEDGLVKTATSVINEIMGVPAKRIPQSLLANAQGIAIIPNVVKVGLIGGVRHGKGVLITRDDSGAWTTPRFVTLTGGSIGWQVGVQAADVILVFKTRKGVANLDRGKFTIGADAAAAAGPVGRQAAAATDSQLKAEILSYSRARGLFAGVSVDGSALQIDNRANAAYYYPAGYMQYGAATGQAPIVPESAINLVATVNQYTTLPQAVTAPQVAAVTSVPAATAAAPPTTSSAAPAARTTSTDHLRHQLVDSAAKLNTLLDDRWKQYLALPSEIFTGTSAPRAEAIDAVLANYDRVARGADYRALANRPEFQATYELLRKYAANQSAPGTGTIELPPPPAAQSRIDTRGRY